MIRFNVVRRPVSISVSQQQSVQMSVEKAALVGVPSREYEGPYEVTPTAVGLTMQTKDRYMRDDVTVKAIPVYNVGNTAGGSTFYIATMNEDPQGGIAILGKAKLGSMIL